MSLGHPPAEIEIDEALVRSLLVEQFPEIADGALQLVGNGWDNVIHRLGTDHIVRMPRREVAAGLIRNEQRYLAQLAPRLPLPVPVPTHAGRPNASFPWPWSICRWLEGERASAAPPSDLDEAAETLAAFVNALHTPAPLDAPINAARGGPHADRLERIAIRIVDVDAVGRLPSSVDATALERLWRELAATPPWSGPSLWLHGDLHGSNLLTNGGRLSAVIDWGDITTGDPATDLAVAWIILDRPSRARFQTLVNADEHTWTRARAWALSFAVFYLDAADDDPVMGRMGRQTLDQVLEA